MSSNGGFGRRNWRGLGSPGFGLGTDSSRVHKNENDTFSTKSSIAIAVHFTAYSHTVEEITGWAKL